MEQIVLMNRIRSWTSYLSNHEGSRRRRYSHYLLLVAGLGGLLYGIDLGIIGGALPYLEATSGLTAEQLSAVVAAVLLGSVFSTLFAGMLSDWFGRRSLMVWSGIAFSLSIPVIALSHSFGFLIAGRILQGTSGGVIGVVVPLYLAECLPASSRGRGTALFQWFLTLGIVISALVGIYYSLRLGETARTASAATIFLLKNQAWRRIFWTSLPGGILFAAGSCFVTESPRWLFRRGERERAYASLLRSRNVQEATLELSEMSLALSQSEAGRAVRQRFRESLLRRKYIVPFLLSCAILFCNTATGVNSITAYDTSLLVQSGLSDISAHWGYVLFTCVKFLMTIVGVMLVDRKGRKFLLVTGTAGMVVSLAVISGLFLRTERTHQDCSRAVQSLVTPEQTLNLRFDPSMTEKLLRQSGKAGHGMQDKRASLAIVYSYGGFTAATQVVRSDDAAGAPIRIIRADGVPSNAVEAFFKNPFANLRNARVAPLKIERAVVARVPDPAFGWVVELLLYIFVAFYSLGPGVCVWLALSELMPTRIRSNGMSIALVINQLVSTTMAAIFLPVVSRYGYSRIFLLFGGCTVVYFLITAFLLPETRGKTLEEIEQFFHNPRLQDEPMRRRSC
jgi:MFS transporter, SP family, solute carrier family 2 (myo-inositol transporter), member 13